MFYTCSTCETRKIIESHATTERSYCTTCRSNQLFRAARSITRQPTLVPCPYFKLCLDYMLSLGISTRLFDRSHNRCYCERCYPTSKPDFLHQAGWKYVIPRGWVRFGLYVDRAKAEVDNIWDKWIVTYHGTQPVVAKSIIEHHRFLLPGDHNIDGVKISIRAGHIPGKYHIYTSPTIAYSAYEAYAYPVLYEPSPGNKYLAKTVLQCRQNPAEFRIQAETIGAKTRRLCPIIPNSELEYFTEVRSSIVPYGLLIRLVRPS